jgi:transcriptional regulator of acetoin/glycerol metabolism
MLSLDAPRQELHKIDAALAALRAVLNPAELESAVTSLLARRESLCCMLDEDPGAPGSEIAQVVLETEEDYQNRILVAWHTFTNTKIVDPITPPVIATSWRRSWAHINPLQEIQFVNLSGSHLLSSQVAGFNLISIARPVIEDILQCSRQSGMAIILTNGAGCVLDMHCDPEMERQLFQWGISPGTILTEEQIGTNAIGLALITRMPVQVSGAEHYARQLHSMADAAAPIFDPSGVLLGVLSVIMQLDKNPRYALGLVNAGVRAIEGQHQADLLLAEQNNQLTQLNTILSAISDGILVWNAVHTLIHVNKAASQMIGLPVKSLVGKQIDTLLSLPESVHEAIEQHKPIQDVEATLKLGGVQSTFLLNADYVYIQSQDSVAWTIITLRPEKKVRNLVQQQTGARAMLTLEDIPGDSPQIRSVRNLVQSVAGAQASVLIRGEPGTGKNVLANAIHNASRRQDAPFLIFAASSIPIELVVSELLGVEEDTTGRLRGSRPSKFELAQGGTLFFQDIECLPLEAQSVLLNVMELGIVQRIRGQRVIQVDTRIIASSTADLDALIAQGSFRADLYYRLSSFLIDIPPLRERPNDIPWVVERILVRLSSQLQRPLSLAPGMIDVLKKAPWVGNVREIEAFLTRTAMQTGPRGEIELKRLPLLLHANRQYLPTFETESHFKSIQELECEAIKRAAQLCQGNLTLMATTLGISRTTLWRRLKSLDFNPTQYQQQRIATAPPIKRPRADSGSRQQ